MNKRISNWVLVALLILSVAGLLSGLFAGMVRLGWVIEGGSPVPPLMHGPLMVNAFLGTLISLERAAALGKKWAYTTPGAMALGTVLLLLGFIPAALWLFVAGAMMLLIVLVHLYQLQPAPYHLLMVAGGGCLIIGNILYAYGFPIFNLVAWWMGFLLLTIFSERLELNRIKRSSQKAQSIFAVLAAVWLIGICLTYVDRYFGWLIASVALIGMATWLFKYDISRKTIRSKAWTKYSAICLLSGYCWLILAGLFGIWKGLPYAGFAYDAQLHMIFLGFVFSMIFAHASVIIPSLTGKEIPYSRYFYLPLILLHSALVLRILSDLLWMPWFRKSGAHSNVLAILLFLGGVAFQLARSSYKKRRRAVHKTI